MCSCDNNRKTTQRRVWRVRVVLFILEGIRVYFTTSRSLNSSTLLYYWFKRKVPYVCCIIGICVCRHGMSCACVIWLMQRKFYAKMRACMRDHCNFSNPWSTFAYILLVYLFLLDPCISGSFKRTLACIAGVLQYHIDFCCDAHYTPNTFTHRETCFSSSRHASQCIL